MQLYLLQAFLIAGALAAWNDRRQVIVTVTAGVPLSTPKAPSAPSPIPLSAPPVPWEQSPPVSLPVSAPTVVPVPASPNTQSGNLSLPPLQPVPSASPGSASPGSVGAKCGKGYTYCGYMLTGGGHSTFDSYHSQLAPVWRRLLWIVGDALTGDASRLRPTGHRTGVLQRATRALRWRQGEDECRAGRLHLPERPAFDRPALMCLQWHVLEQCHDQLHCPL